VCVPRETGTLCVCGNSGVTYIGHKRLSQGSVWIFLLCLQGWCVNSGQWSSLSGTSCPLSQPELRSRGAGLSSPISLSDALWGGKYLLTEIHFCQTIEDGPWRRVGGGTVLSCRVNLFEADVCVHYLCADEKKT